jgi:hypothetical protein
MRALWTRSMVVLGTGLLVLAASGAALAAPPWASLIPFKKIEANPQANYELTEQHGPWLIMCTSFAGPTAEQQAHDLVLELRQKFKLEAFSYRQTFDFTDTTEGIGYNRYGERKRMRYLNGSKFDEIAVMVGHFVSLENPEVDKALDTIKHAHPETLGAKYGAKSSQRFGGLRTIYRTVTLNAEIKEKGPMGAAFVTKNPLLPDEYFNASGLDPFLVEINKDLPHSLLNCQGKYTVRVAVFRGVDTMKVDEFEKLTSKERPMSKIDEAALKASKLCAALRARGVEAYEFHDRTESIVTIGSFQQYGTPRNDGKTEINPAMYQIMEQYGPQETAVAWDPNSKGLQLRTEKVSGMPRGMSNMIPFDAQPWPVEVPKQSIAAAYNQSNELYR